MTNHKVQIDYGRGTYSARCSCRQQSKFYAQRWQAEDWRDQHLALVERIKSHLGHHNPSLKSQRDYYHQMENDPEVTEHDRGLWRQLREELDRRLNTEGCETVDEQLPLGEFDDTPRKSSHDLRQRGTGH